LDIAKYCHALARLGPSCSGGKDQVHRTFVCLSSGNIIASSSCVSGSVSACTNAGANVTADSVTQVSTSGLTTGAKVGAGVGAISGILALVGVGLCCGRRRKEADQEKQVDEPEKAYVKPEVDQESTNFTHFNQPLQLNRKNTAKTHSSEEDPGANELFALHDFLKTDPASRNAKKTMDG
jgi:hypothetical protein